jgi:hypothetical protein
MLEFAGARLGRRLTPVHGNFEHTSLPACDAIIASLSLHHLSTRRRKTAMYGRCFAALAAPGVLISADCCLASLADLQRQDRRVWRDHLERSYTPSQARALLRAWAREDTYFPLADEIAMMQAAGFTVDVPWRRHAFAVIVARKHR